MDVKQAVRIAKEYLGDLFEAEQIMNVGLEEVVYPKMRRIAGRSLSVSRGPGIRKASWLPRWQREVRGVPTRSFTSDKDSGRVGSLTDRLLKSPE